MHHLVLVLVGSMVLAFLPDANAQPTPPTEPAEFSLLDRSWNLYWISGDNMEGVGAGFLENDTYLGLELTREENFEPYGHCDKSDRISTIVLTPGVSSINGKTRYVFNAILGYYEVDYLDTCAYPAESDDSGFDYGVGVSISLMVSPDFGFMLGLRWTDGSEAGMTFGISW